MPGHTLTPLCTWHAAQTLQAATAETNMSMNSAVPQPLAGAINASFGNYTAFRMKMTAEGMGVFGSGEFLHRRMCSGV